MMACLTALQDIGPKRVTLIKEYLEDGKSFGSMMDLSEIGMSEKVVKCSSFTHYRGLRSTVSTSHSDGLSLNCRCGRSLSRKMQ